MKTKVIILLLFLLLYSNNILFSQQYLGDCTISHSAYIPWNFSNKWKSETKKKNTLYRNVEFNFKFDQNCKYELEDACGASEQTRKQKVMKLCTNQNSQSLNSLRIGWFYDPDKEKFYLAFYSHINHTAGKDALYVNEGKVGREYQVFDKTVDADQWVHIKMAMAKKGMYMSMDDEAILVSRNISSWSQDGETSFLRANSYFEYEKDMELLPCIPTGPPHNMDFYIKEAIMDNPDFPWNDKYSECAMVENLRIMDSYFEFSYQGPYNFITTKSIIAPITPISADNIQTELPFKIPFTVVNSGINVSFTAGESILLKKGFHAKAGSHFTAKIEDVQMPVSPVVTSEPELLSPTVCYTVKNTDYCNFDLYNWWDEWITGGPGSINGNNACFEIPGYEELPNGKYTLVSTFSNTCKSVNIETLLLKVDKGIAVLKNNDSSKPLKQPELTIKNSLIIKSADGSLSLYPNPSPGIFTLRFNDGQTESYSVEVRNMMGKTVFKKENIRDEATVIDIRNEAKGIYLIKLSAGGKVYTDKMIVQ